jgi:[acyl-carrier-protein] S-malonyltransferase
MKPAEDRLAPELRALRTRAPRRPVVANIDAEPKRDAASAIEALVQQVSGAVRWEAVVRRLASEGVRTYVEVGPGSVLAGLVRKIDPEARAVSVGDDKGLLALDELQAAPPR